jgi:hypothetical protein
VLRLRTSVAARSVWKDEIRLLLELEDLADGPDSGPVREELLRLLSDPETGRDAAGLLAFVLTARPTDERRKELARCLGKVKEVDAALVYAVTIRNPRLAQPSDAREAFWKGCMNLMERDRVLSLGFRERLFKEEYGRSLEEVKRQEVVAPSPATLFDQKTNASFHALQKKGFSTFIEPGEEVRTLLTDYLAKGDSPEAKAAICMSLRPGPDLALASRDAFLNSASYPEAVRRHLLNRAEAGAGGWEVLQDLLPAAGPLKLEILERMANHAGKNAERQARTLDHLQKELELPGLSESQVDRLVDGVAKVKSESAEGCLRTLSRSHSSEMVREAALGRLTPAPGERLAPEVRDPRARCAEDALLRDSSTKVRATAVTALARLVATGAVVEHPEEIRAQVQVLAGQQKIDRAEADALLQALRR